MLCCDRYHCILPRLSTRAHVFPIGNGVHCSRHVQMEVQRALIGNSPEFTPHFMTTIWWRCYHYWLMKGCRESKIHHLFFLTSYDFLFQVRFFSSNRAAYLWILHSILLRRHFPRRRNTIPSSQLNSAINNNSWVSPKNLRHARNKNTELNTIIIRFNKNSPPRSV